MLLLEVEIMAVYFIKFMDSKYIPSLEQGNMYFSPLKTFDKTNDKHDTKKINDPNEGESFIRISSSDKTKHLFRNGQDITKYLVDNDYGYCAELKLFDERVKKIGVFCCTVLDTRNSNDFEANTPQKIILLPSKNKVRIDTKFTLKKSFLRHLYNIVGGNDRVPVLISPDFLKLFHIKEIPLMYGRVKYYDNKTQRNFNPIATNDEMIKQSVFQKDSIYSDEKELRIALLRDCSLIENRTIKIGNITNYIVSFDERIPEIYFIENEYYDIEEIKKHAKKLTQIDTLLIKKELT